MREKLSIHGEEYEKRWVEEIVMNDPAPPSTVLRLPAIHGPGDYRPFIYLKRMDDRRPFILLDKDKASWHFSRGYVENVANAIVLAATNDQAKNRIYNVADTTPSMQLQWIQFIGKAANWIGHIIKVSRAYLPEHLKDNADYRQHWCVDTARIRKELGYREVVHPLEGIRRTVAWIRAHPPEQVDPAEFDYPAEDKALERQTLSDP
ncbi:MAG: hypothetical protein L0287_01355 [Anaerolineae bacterium]|nr:hypothetical protein [Anaerolineae bacterium]